MTGFKTALTAKEGSLITDGTYVFKNNGQEDGCGISLQGKVHGSMGKDKLTITADDICDTDFYTDSVVFENCTVSVTSQTRTWFDARNLTLKNACLSVAGFGMSYYVNNLTMENSEFTINKRGWRHATGLTIQGSSTIKDSTITANAGSTAGISVGAQDKEINIINSTLVFNNGGTGGLNVNTGKVVLNDSTIKGNGKNSGALFGAQENGSIEFLGNCLVETPAATNMPTLVLAYKTIISLKVAPTPLRMRQTTMQVWEVQFLSMERKMVTNSFRYLRLQIATFVCLHHLTNRAIRMNIK